MRGGRIVKRGEVYMAKLQPRSGSEQQGNRPVMVMSHDSFNDNPRWRSIIVIPFSTSPTQSQRGPTAVMIVAGDGGLKHDSIAVCHQVTTLDRAKLGKRLGKLSETAMANVEAGLKAATDLP